MKLLILSITYRAVILNWQFNQFRVNHYWKVTHLVKEGEQH